MDYSNEIKFSNILIKNGEAYITYSGNLYTQNSNSVHIVYGFGDNWEHTTEKEMEMNAHGFVAKIRLLDYDKFNFCFKNQYNEWDNNNGQNYSLPIIEDTGFENNFIINEGLLDNLINDIFSNSTIINNYYNQSTLMNNTVNTLENLDNNSNEESENINTPNTNDVLSSDKSNTQIADIFSENVNESSDFDKTNSSCIEDNQDIEISNNTKITDNNTNDAEDIIIADIDVSTLEIQSDDLNISSQINNTISDDNDTSSLVKNTISNDIDTSSLVNSTISNDIDNSSQENNTISDDADIFSQENNSISNSTDNSSQENNSILDDIDNSSQEKIIIDNTSESNKENTTTEEFDMNSLIDEILSPIVTSEDFVEENLEDYKVISNNKVLDDIDDNKYKEEDAQIDDVITNYLNDLYSNINSNEDNSVPNAAKDSDASNNYSELDKTISKFKQIQALQDLDSFFDNSFNNTSNVSEINKSSNLSNITTDNIIDEKINNNLNSITDTLNGLNNAQENEHTYTNNNNEINNNSDEIEEQSLIEDAININSSNTAQTNLEQSLEQNINENNTSENEFQNDETALIVSPRHLSSLYIIKKKFKLSLLKIFRFIPRLLNKNTNEQ